MTANQWRELLLAMQRTLERDLDRDQFEEGAVLFLERAGYLVAGNEDDLRDRLCGVEVDRLAAELIEESRQ